MLAGIESAAAGLAPDNLPGIRRQFAPAIAALESTGDHEQGTELARVVIEWENRARLSSRVQALFHEANVSGVMDWIALAEHLQGCVLAAVGFSDAAAGRQFLARAVTAAPDLKRSARHLQHNRQEPCALQLGCPVPDCALVDTGTGRSVTLHSLVGAHERVILVAGSLT